MKMFFRHVALSVRIVVLLAAPAAGLSAQPPHPKILIGLVVDQMRWDYLVRFRDRYTPGGFRRLLSRGFSCDNVQIDYSPSVTACGHTAVYTGSIPAITGIVGNDWYDRYHHKKIYCTEDSTGRMSPANLLTTTLGDEMNLADNFSSKVVGIALKDRAAILPAGHTATAAFWFDGAGFITSTWYMQTLPPWVQKFNSSGNMQKYDQKDWNTFYPPATYTQSTADDEPWETVSPGEQKPVFPHKNSIRATPFGDDLTLDFAKAAIEGFGPGAGAHQLICWRSAFQAPMLSVINTGPTLWK